MKVKDLTDYDKKAARGALSVGDTVEINSVALVEVVT